jgi:CubicO group peptidase (beta-lactamase class C family)
MTSDRPNPLPGVLLATLLVGCGSSKQAPAPGIQTSPADAADPRFAAVLSYLQSKMTADGVPGAAIAIVENGSLAFQAGVGVESLGGRMPVQATTLFRVASLSKMVLAATTMKLVEQGKVDLSQPVTSYVPFAVAPPYDASTITLDRLLTHTSGIPDGDQTSRNCPVGPGQSADWFAAQGPKPLWAPPGAVFAYSNTGYSVMGWVIESVTGKVYDQVATELVLDPAGMTEATFDPALAQAADHAVGDNFGTLVEPTDFDCAVRRPPAGLMASVVDYAHFAEMLLASGGSVLKPSSVAAMESGRAPTDDYPGGIEAYGYGLFVRQRDLRVVWHNGQDVGYQSSVYVVPAAGWAAIVFYNAESGDPDDISQFAVDTFLLPAGAEPTSYTTPPSTWSRYEGTYASAIGQYDTDVSLGPTIAVTLQGDQLVATTSSSTLPLTQVAGDRFQFPWKSPTTGGDTQEVTFFPDDAGTPAWFVTKIGVGARE